MMISYLVLPQKKVCLSAWNVTIRDSVLVSVVFWNPCLKGKGEYQNVGLDLKNKRDCPTFTGGGAVLWPRSFSESCFPPRLLPFFVLSVEQLSVLQFENLWD